MKEREDEIARLLAALGGARAPDALRERTLARARQAWTHEGLVGNPVADPWRRVWESRTLRVAWAVTVLVLLLLAFAPLPGPPSRSQAAAAASASDADTRELQAVLRLPRLDLGLVSVEAAVAGGSDRGAAAARAPRPERGRT
jgi:hypothetical protein